MDTASIADRSFAPNVALLGSQGWIVAPAGGEPRIGIATQLQQWLQRSRTRREITELDDHLLRDIGLTRSDVMAESRKHFWQP